MSHFPKDLIMELNSDSKNITKLMRLTDAFYSMMKSVKPISLILIERSDGADLCISDCSGTMQTMLSVDAASPIDPVLDYCLTLSGLLKEHSNVLGDSWNNDTLHLSKAMFQVYSHERELFNVLIHGATITMSNLWLSHFERTPSLNKESVIMKNQIHPNDIVHLNVFSTAFCEMMEKDEPTGLMLCERNDGTDLHISDRSGNIQTTISGEFYSPIDPVLNYCLVLTSLLKRHSTLLDLSNTSDFNLIAAMHHTHLFEPELFNLLVGELPRVKKLWVRIVNYFSTQQSSNTHNTEPVGRNTISSNTANFNFSEFNPNKESELMNTDQDQNLLLNALHHCAGSFQQQLASKKPIFVRLFDYDPLTGIGDCRLQFDLDFVTIPAASQYVEHLVKFLTRRLAILPMPGSSISGFDIGLLMRNVRDNHRPLFDVILNGYRKLEDQWCMLFDRRENHDAYNDSLAEPKPTNSLFNPNKGNWRISNEPTPDRVIGETALMRLLRFPHLIRFEVRHNKGTVHSVAPMFSTSRTYAQHTGEILNLFLTHLIKGLETTKQLPEAVFSSDTPFDLRVLLRQEKLFNPLSLERFFCPANMQLLKQLISTWQFGFSAADAHAPKGMYGDAITYSSPSDFNNVGVAFNSTVPEVVFRTFDELLVISDIVDEYNAEEGGRSSEVNNIAELFTRIKAKPETFDHIACRLDGIVRPLMTAATYDGKRPSPALIELMRMYDVYRQYKQTF
jgi:hypothetical protein